MPLFACETCRVLPGENSNPAEQAKILELAVRLDTKGISRLRTANGRGGGSIFVCDFLPSCALQGGVCFRGCRTRASSGIEIELPHLVKQRLIADAQHSRGVFAAPVGFLECIGDRFGLRFIFQSAHERLEPLFFRGWYFLLRSHPLL